MTPVHKTILLFIVLLLTDITITKSLKKANLALDTSRRLCSNTDWVHCTIQGALCNPPIGCYVKVRYGHGNSFTEKKELVSGSIDCENSYFGKDPSPGENKICQYKAIKPNEDFLGKKFKPCTDENGSCNLKYSTLVMYGTFNRFQNFAHKFFPAGKFQNFAHKVFPAGKVTCDDATFGFDPLKYTSTRRKLPKKCFYAEKLDK